MLAANAAAAATLRASFETSGTLVVNLISSPGSGKTTLLEKTAAALKDFAPPRRRSRATSRPSATPSACAAWAFRRGRSSPAGRAISTPAWSTARWPRKARALAGLDILFIENVGNLICPTSYDLGEDFKVVLLSVTEGEDKPFKYPAIFSKAAVTVVTKTDLLPYVPFDLAAAREQVRTLESRGPTPRGLRASRAREWSAWLDLLQGELAKKREKVRVGGGVA